LGRRGPAPKPTQQKKLEGNPGRRKLPKNEPQPKDGAPPCPAFLDGPARSEWKRIVPELLRLKLLTIVDRAALAAYCQNWSRWAKAEGVIGKLGMTFTSDGGMVRKRPEVGIAAEAMKLMRSFLIEFGLTPAARTRVVSNADDEPEEKDDLDEALDAEDGA
jgi:P27 family predicted phage terminase small subunit